MTNANKPNILFWVIAVILVLWNLMGASAFIVDNFATEMIADAYTAEQMVIIESTPLWSKILYGISTLGGLLAAILLIARKIGAVRMYLISLLALIIHTIYNVGFENAMEVFGVGQGLIFPLFIVLLAVFEYWYSKYSASKGWLS